MTRKTTCSIVKDFCLYLYWVVVDLHPAWCGGVEILAQQFNSIHNSISDPEKRLNWISVR